METPNIVELGRRQWQFFGGCNYFLSGNPQEMFIGIQNQLDILFWMCLQIKYTPVAIYLIYRENDDKPHKISGHPIFRQPSGL